MKTRKTCYGCSACAYVCKHGAIVMKHDTDGFMYPSVDSKKCVSCGLCHKVCPSNDGCLPIKTYAGQIKAKDILLKCASGGAFTSIAEKFITEGGCVYAAADCMNEPPSFIAIDTIEDLYKVQGSKYFQVDLKETDYSNIYLLLKASKKILFCGTPCQTAAVKNVFKRFSDNLYTIDLICGGTPSYKVVKQYRDYKEKLFNSKLKEHCFRAKDKTNFHGYQSRLIFEDGRVVKYLGMKDEYTRLFSCGIILRNSCYNCEFSTDVRNSDVTIGDYWGITGNSKFYTEKGSGVSVLLCNTDKGVNMIESLNNLELEVAEIEYIKKYQRPLRNKANKRFERPLFMWLLNILPFVVAEKIVNYRYFIKKIIKLGKNG